MYITLVRCAKIRKWPKKACTSDTSSVAPCWRSPAASDVHLPGRGCSAAHMSGATKLDRMPARPHAAVFWFLLYGTKSHRTVCCTRAV